MLTGDRINEGFFLQENVWSFCQAAKKSGLNNEVTVRRGFLYLEPVYPPPVILHSWKSPAALVNEYEGNGDSENVARVKADNALVSVYRKELRKVLLEHMPSQLSPKWKPED